MTYLRIEIPIEPRGQGRARVAVRGKYARVYKADADDQYEGTLRTFFRDAMRGRDIPPGPVRIDVLAVFTLAKSHHRKTRPVPERRHVGKPDIDNVLKAVCDAANGILWVDDTQVCEAHAEKWTAAQGEPGRLVVTVTEIEDAIPQPKRSAKSALFTPPPL